MSKTPTIETLQAIAEAENRTQAMKNFEVSPTTFYRLCRKFGIEYRRKGSPYVLTAHEDDLIQQLIAADIPIKAIARKMEVSAGSIRKRKMRHDAGIPTRSAQE